MSLADLRKELKVLRKKSMPTPVSRMKKTECAAEIERLKGLHRIEETKVDKVLAEEKVPKKTAKKDEAVQAKEHTKQEEVVKKTKGVKSAPAETKEAKPSKKGSEEMKERMAKLREMRKKKKESE